MRPSTKNDYWVLGAGLALGLGLATLAGCSMNATNAGRSDAGGGGPSDDGGGGSPDGGGARALSCLGVLMCVNSNNCSANACVDMCLAQGTPDAQTQVTDLATCSQNASCMDAACLQTNCKTQLDACLAGSAPAPTGMPLQGGAMPGNVPANFVGTWIAGDSFDLSDEKQFQFNADGTGEYAESYNGGFSQCSSAVITKYDGTVAIDTGAMSITVYATTVTETTNTCGTPSTMPQPAKTLSFTYQDDGEGDGGLIIVDSVCAAQYTSHVDINLYCSYTYHKQ